MFPMTPLQSWVTIAALFVLIYLLVYLIAKADRAVDRRLAAKRGLMSNLSDSAAQLPGTSSAPTATPNSHGDAYDGFLVPARDQVYDYTVHGL